METTTATERQITNTEKEVFEFLNDLRESGRTNMFSASPFIKKKFKFLSSVECLDLLKLWMRNFRKDGMYTTIKES